MVDFFMAPVGTEFLESVRRHWGSLHRVARRYACDDELARDLVQETLLRAWKGFSPTEARHNSRAWLFVIMRSVVVDWHRMKRSRVTLTLGLDVELTELSPADLTEPLSPLPSMNEAQFLEFLDERIVSALENLEPVFREVVVLSVAGDLTYREIAEVLDCPVGTVMSRMARARRSLRERLSTFAAQAGWLRESKR